MQRQTRPKIMATMEINFQRQWRRHDSHQIKIRQEEIEQSIKRRRLSPKKSMRYYSNSFKDIWVKQLYCYTKRKFIFRIALSTDIRT